VFWGNVHTILGLMRTESLKKTRTLSIPPARPSMPHRLPLLCTGASTLEHELDWITGDHMHDGKDNDRHTEEHRDDQEEPSSQILHVLSSAALYLWNCLGFISHSMRRWDKKDGFSAAPKGAAL